MAREQINEKLFLFFARYEVKIVIEIDNCYEGMQELYIYNKRVTRAILRSIKFMLLLLIFDSIRTRFCKDLNFGVNNDIF